MDRIEIEGWMGLEINRNKTRVIDLKQQGEKLNFLGYMFRYEEIAKEDNRAIST